MVMLPLFLLTILALCFQNNISFDILETSTMEQNGLKFFIVTTGALFLVFGVYLILDKVPETVLFIVLALLYLAGGIYLITHIQMELRYDSGICYWNALNFRGGDYSNLQLGEYFYEYPHQLGLVSYNCLLIWISDDPNFVYFVNLLWILLGNFFMWRTTALIFEYHSKVRKMVILMSYAFLPQFFYLFYAYGQVPGLGCLMIAVYLTIRAVQKESPLSMVLSLVFMGMTCLLRMNYAIGGIAMLIVYLLYALRRKKLLWGVAAAGVVVSMILPRYVVDSYYEKAANTDLSNGSPALLHIAMGLQENEEPWRAAGWYNDFNHQTYLAANCDVEASKELAIESIKERLQTFIQDPGYAVDFFGEKVITTWCEPTYQSVWSGPLICMGCQTDEAWLTELYSGGRIFQVLSSAMNVLIVMIFGFSLVCVLWKTLKVKRPLNGFELFAVLFFLGGFLFHLAWETKSQYVYPYVVMLIPVAAMGGSVFCECVFSILQSFFQRFNSK